MTWAKYMYGSIGRLVAPLLYLVQHFHIRLVQGQFQPYSGGVRGVEVFHIVALYDVLQIVFLADGDGSFLMVAGDVHAEDLQKCSHGESTLASTSHLNFEHPFDANNLVSRRAEVNSTILKTQGFSRLAISLCDAVFQRATWGRPMTFLEVFGTRSDFPPPEQLDCVLVLM